MMAEALSVALPSQNILLRFHFKMQYQFQLNVLNIKYLLKKGQFFNMSRVKLLMNFVFQRTVEGGGKSQERR